MLFTTLWVANTDSIYSGYNYIRFHSGWLAQELFRWASEVPIGLRKAGNLLADHTFTVIARPQLGRYCAQKEVVIVD